MGCGGTGTTGEVWGVLVQIQQVCVALEGRYRLGRGRRLTRSSHSRLTGVSGRWWIQAAADRDC